MWLPVDYPTFLDALQRADDRGARIRPRDVARAMALFAAESFDPFQLAVPITGAAAPKGGLIEKGLYRGIFRYDLDEHLAWRWFARTPRGTPLRRWEDREMLDVAVSYSSEDRDVALGLVDALGRCGLEAHAIDVAADPDDDLWRLRYLEGLFRSRHFIPVLTASYLAREGSRVEAQEISSLTAAHRATEHYYPLLPWVIDDPHQVERTWTRLEIKEEGGFGWLLRHVPPIPDRWSPTDLATFVSSLVAAAHDLEADRPVADRRFLDLLRDDVSGVQQYGDVTRLSFRHPWWEDRHYTFGLTRDGRMRYLGVEDRPCGPAPASSWGFPTC